MQNDDPNNDDSGSNNSPSSNADEPEKPETPYTAPDGREHILDFDDEKINIKSPQSDNTKK